MKPQYLFLAALAGLAVAGGAWGQTPAVTDESSAQSAIVAINEAPTIYVAETAYRKAVAADPGDTEVYQAYMQRSLALGRLDQAARAAAMLRFLTPRNAQAWAVTAWQRMQIGDRTGSLDNIVRALALQRDDPAVLSLAGRLYAWQDADSSARPLPDASGQMMAQLRDSLMDRSAFQAAYNEVKSAWAARGSDKPALDSSAAEPAPALAAVGLGSQNIPPFALSAFLTPESTLQPAASAGERVAAVPAATNATGGPFSYLQRGNRRGMAGRSAVRPGSAMPPGTTVLASPLEAGQAPNQTSPSSAGVPSYGSGGGGSYGNDMGPMFPHSSRFVPTYGGYIDAPVGGAMLQPNLRYPSTGRMIMRYR